MSDQEQEDEARGDSPKDKAEGANPGTGSRRRRRKRPEASAEATTAAPVPAVAQGESREQPTAGEGERVDLPKWNRARVKRKAPADVTDDAFVGGVRKAGKSVVAQAPVVLGAIVVIAAVITGVVLWRDHQQGELAVSTRVLTEAVGWRSRGQVGEIPESLEGRKLPDPLAKDVETLNENVNTALQGLAEQAADSEANLSADLVRAATAMEKSNFADAQQLYDSFLETRGKDHPLAFLAREGVVLALEGQGDVAGALGRIEPLVGEKGDFYRDVGLWHKGRLLEAQGEGDAALEVYKQYSEEYPLADKSLAQDQVRGRLETLAPELVPPKTPPSGLGGLEAMLRGGGR